MSQQKKSLDEIQAQWSKYDRPDDGALYRHYKGGEYTIVATGFLEDSEIPCVVYRAEKYGTVWVRTANNFFEEVDYNGRQQPRFKKVGTDAEKENRP